jgi:hypothetical protein
LVADFLEVFDRWLIISLDPVEGEIDQRRVSTPRRHARGDRLLARLAQPDEDQGDGRLRSVEQLLTVRVEREG